MKLMSVQSGPMDEYLAVPVRFIVCCDGCGQEIKSTDTANVLMPKTGTGEVLICHYQCEPMIPEASLLGWSRFVRFELHTESLFRNAVQQMEQMTN